MADAQGLRWSASSSPNLYGPPLPLQDEVTVDLDVVARMDLLEIFKEECEQRGATIVYATHIFDGLETWATDLVYIQEGTLRKHEKMSELSELKQSPNLLSVVEAWLRAETKIEKKKKPIDDAAAAQVKNHHLLMHLRSDIPAIRLTR